MRVSAAQSRHPDPRSPLPRPQKPEPHSIDEGSFSLHSVPLLLGFRIVDLFVYDPTFSHSNRANGTCEDEQHLLLGGLKSKRQSPNPEVAKSYSSKPNTFQTWSAVLSVEGAISSFRELDHLGAHAEARMRTHTPVCQTFLSWRFPLRV